MGDRIRRRAVELLDVQPGETAWDLYAGSGRASTLLAAAGARVESVEQDSRAVALAAAEETAGVCRHAGRVEEHLPGLAPAERVLANPPRSGLGRTVTDMLADRKPGRIVYVSCDPATLARDVAALAPGYRVAVVEAFDLFPQTAHVETVVALDRGER
jgi:23S rRNA (uracil1939-C5)-methyltransferase